MNQGTWLKWRLGQSYLIFENNQASIRRVSPENSPPWRVLDGSAIEFGKVCLAHGAGVELGGPLLGGHGS